VLLVALRGHGLLRERKLGIVSSVIEANASLRAGASQHRGALLGLRAAAGCETGALAYNLSVLLRHLFGVGTLKQALALGRNGLLRLLRQLLAWIRASKAPPHCIARFTAKFFRQTIPQTPLLAKRGFSTGC
jgi:hypothetical protein